MVNVWLKTLLAGGVMALVCVALNAPVSAAPVTTATQATVPHELVQNAYWVRRGHHRFWRSDRHHH